MTPLRVFGPIVVLACLASCVSTEPPPTAPPIPGIAAPAPVAASDAQSKLATLQIGESRQADVRKLLGAPNEVETIRTPCGPSCLKTTVTWTYFQIRNGKLNAQSSSSPVTLTFDGDSVLSSMGGSWTDIPNRAPSGP